MRVVKLTWFVDAGRKSFGFSVSIELDLIPMWGIEVSFLSVSGSL